MAKGCVLSTGYLPRGGLSRNSVDMITDRPDMTSAVDRGRNASTQRKMSLTVHYFPLIEASLNVDTILMFAPVLKTACFSVSDSFSEFTAPTIFMSDSIMSFLTGNLFPVSFMNK